MQDNLMAKQKKEEKEINKKKEKNIHIYQRYKMVAWDLLFYYSIIYLFLTIEKGISPAEVMQFDAFYVIFRFLMQIPCTIIIERIGKRKSLILANFLLLVHMIIILIARNFFELLISQVLCAISYNIKGICESDMLYDSLEKGEQRGIQFGKIDGKAVSYYYYLDAISAVLSGFLFVINSYIPMILCFLLLVIAFLLSIKFENVEEKRKPNTIKREMKNIRYSLKKIVHSKRLLCLLIFNITFVAMIKIMQTMRNTTLKELGMPEQYFGVAFAILGILSGIAAKNQGRIHKKFRNKTLGFLGIPVAISILLLGIIIYLKLPFTISIILVIGLLIVQAIMKGPYYVLIKQYLNNFTNSEKRVKIITANSLFENLVVSIALFVASFIMDNVPIYYALIVIGCVFILALTFLLEFMKGKVGLKMEEYPKKEIL